MPAADGVGCFGALHPLPMSGNVRACRKAAEMPVAGCRRHEGGVLERRHEGFDGWEHKRPETRNHRPPAAN